MRIGLDIDDVTFNLVEVWLRMYNEEYDDNLTLEDIETWEFSGMEFKCSVDAFRRYLDNSYLQLTSRPFEGVKDTLRAWVKQGHLPVFITATRRSVAGAKLDKLLMELGPDMPFEVHFTKEKQFVQCDIYVDDNPHDIARYLTTTPFGRPVVVFDRPWNRDMAASDWHDWCVYFAAVAHREAPYAGPGLLNSVDENPIRVYTWEDLADVVHVHQEVLKACGKT